MVCCCQDLPNVQEKLKYIGEVPGDATNSEWKEDAQVGSWLWNSMELHISCDFLLLDTAYAVWKSLY